MEDDTVAASPDELALGPTELVETPETVGDDHDHAEGRGLPVARLVAGVVTPTEVAGNAAPGWGLVPPGAVVWFRSLAELTAAGAGWTRETTLDGRYPIGAGTTGSGSGAQTFAAGSAYGSTWEHQHGDDHTHTTADHGHSLNAHTHTIGSHTHTMKNHTHSGGTHTHTMKNHTHTIGIHDHAMKSHSHTVNSHTHDLQNHLHTQPSHVHALGNTPSSGWVAGASTIALGSETPGGGADNTGVAAPNSSGGTSPGTGAPNDNTTNGSAAYASQAPNDNTSDGSSAHTSAAPNDNTSDGTTAYTSGTPSPADIPTHGGLPTNSKNLAGFGTVTSMNTWIPPSMAGCFGRKL